MSPPHISLLHSKFAYIIFYSTFPFGCLIGILHCPLQNWFLKQKIHLYLQSFSSLWQSHPSGCSCLKLVTFPLFLFFHTTCPQKNPVGFTFKTYPKSTYFHNFYCYHLDMSWQNLQAALLC